VANVFLADERVSASNDYDKVLGFHYFLSEMGQRGIPSEAFAPEFQAMSDVDDWVGEVKNGGNSQFIGNKGPNAEPMLGRVVSLLQACGASAHGEVAKGVLAWLRAHPEEAALQTGFTGGRAEALDELDQAFWAAERGGEVYGSMARALMARPDVRLVPEAGLKAALDAEARRLLENDPVARQHICHAVAECSRQWLSNPLKMGVALASGSLTDGVLVPVGLDATREGDGAIKWFVVLVGRSGSEPTRNIGHVLLNGSGLRFFGDSNKEPVDLFVSRAEIRRATKMALAFRLPESVGLRWGKVQRPFSIGLYRFMVMPASNWAPHKWRVTWVGDTDWAVKGSPNRSTFIWGDDYDQKETLMQEDIAARITGLGLTSG
jgi:hypothetical protein